LLWQFQTGFGADGPPMTYEIDGEQCVALATGGTTNSRGNGDGLWAFKLGGRLSPLYPPPAPMTVTALTGAPVNIDQVSIGRLWDADNKELSANAERPASRHLSPWIKPAPTRTRVFHIPGCTAR
jgi:alcohol dehydrogenase (cytochrome c)